MWKLFQTRFCPGPSDLVPTRSMIPRPKGMRFRINIGRPGVMFSVDMSIRDAKTDRGGDRVLATAGL
jgi:hypothetical protein